MSKKADKVQELENKQSFSALQSKVNDLEAQLKRAVADYHNLERRVAEGRSELTKWGTGELLVKLLPVLDHLDQALAGVSEAEKQSGPAMSDPERAKQVEGESNGWVRGVKLAVKEFKNVLQSEGLSEIAADGQFDPTLHEAVDTGVGDDNKILRVVRRGYQLNGKVIRPAQVVVGRKNPPTQEETENLPGGETQSDFHIPPEEEKYDRE